MRFIKKQRLVETGVNPLNVTIKEDDPNKLFVQSILNAIASETEAGVEYEQILSNLNNLKDTNLKNLFKDTLEDIHKEEIKHLAQLNTQLSKVDMLSDAYKDGVEEANSGKDAENSEKNESTTVLNTKKQALTESITLNEALNLKRKYARDDIEQILSTLLDVDDEQYDYIVYDILEVNDTDRMISGEEVYKILNNIINYLNAGDEKELILKAVEERLNATTDPELEKLNDDIEDLEYDITSITECLSGLYSDKAINIINSILEELEAEKSKLKVEKEIMTQEHA